MLLDNHQGVIIGGLIQEKDRTVIKKLPWLGDVEVSSESCSSDVKRSDPAAKSSLPWCRTSSNDVCKTSDPRSDYERDRNAAVAGSCCNAIVGPGNLDCPIVPARNMAHGCQSRSTASSRNANHQRRWPSMHQCAHHHHPSKDYGRAFATGVALNLVFVFVEATYGWWAGSLALLADAGHNLSDVLGLLMAWGGYALAKVAPSPQRTYGWRGSTILAALFNALLLLVAVGGIAWEAIGRLSNPTDVSAPIVIIVALIGVLINTLTAMLFMRGRDKDMNIRGAYLHMAADALLSLGVAVAGAVIIWTGWLWVDPVTSLIIAMVILVATWGLLRESLHLAMQAVPPSIDIDEVQDFLGGLPGRDRSP